MAETKPTGHKLVPIEPTDSMVETGCDNNATQWTEGTDRGFPADVANDVYVSMVRASPAPSPEVVDWLCRCMWPDAWWWNAAAAAYPPARTEYARGFDRSRMLAFLTAIQGESNG